MDLLADPQTWLSLLTLTLLEIVLGIDNVILLTVLVGRLPAGRRASARLLGLAFAMMTRLALLFSITWLASLRSTLFTAMGRDISGRDLILCGGGLFLVVNSILEIRGMITGRHRPRAPGMLDRFWMIILQIGVIDVVFSIDSVFTAIGLARRIEVMVAAIVASVVFMIWVSRLVGEFIDRHPSVKVLALAFLVLVGGSLVAESFDAEIPQGYLYVAMAFAAAVELVNLRLRKPAP